MSGKRWKFREDRAAIGAAVLDALDAGDCWKTICDRFDRGERQLRRYAASVSRERMSGMSEEKPGMSDHDACAARVAC